MANMHQSSLDDRGLHDAFRATADFRDTSKPSDWTRSPRSPFNHTFTAAKPGIHAFTVHNSSPLELANSPSTRFVGPHYDMIPESAFSSAQTPARPRQPSGPALHDSPKYAHFLSPRHMSPLPRTVPSREMAGYSRSNAAPNQMQVQPHPTMSLDHLQRPSWSSIQDQLDPPTYDTSSTLYHVGVLETTVRLQQRLRDGVEVSRLLMESANHASPSRKDSLFPRYCSPTVKATEHQDPHLHAVAVQSMEPPAQRLRQQTPEANQVPSATVRQSPTASQTPHIQSRKPAAVGQAPLASAQRSSTSGPAHQGPWHQYAAPVVQTGPQRRERASNLQLPTPLASKSSQGTPAPRPSSLAATHPAEYQAQAAAMQPPSSASLKPAPLAAQHTSLFPSSPKRGPPAAPHVGLPNPGMRAQIQPQFQSTKGIKRKLHDQIQPATSARSAAEPRSPRRSPVRVSYADPTWQISTRIRPAESQLYGRGVNQLEPEDPVVLSSVVMIGLPFGGMIEMAHKYPDDAVSRPTTGDGEAGRGD